jgi:hypothetical protein
MVAVILGIGPDVRMQAEGYEWLSPAMAEATTLAAQPGPVMLLRVRRSKAGPAMSVMRGERLMRAAPSSPFPAVCAMMRLLAGDRREDAPRGAASAVIRLAAPPRPDRVRVPQEPK